jgi:hypothetical protein
VLREAVVKARSQPIACIRGLEGMTLYEQMPFTDEDMRRLEDPRVVLAVMTALTQAGKALAIGWVTINLLVQVPCVYVLMGINAKSALYGLYDKVFAEAGPESDEVRAARPEGPCDRPTSYMSKLGLARDDVRRSIWTDTAGEYRATIVRDIRRGDRVDVVCALASKANLDAMFGRMSDEELARVAVIVDESHDLFDVASNDAPAREPGEPRQHGEDGPVATDVATALKKWIFRRRQGGGGGVDLRVHSLHLVTACSGDLANVLRWTGIPHLDKAGPDEAAWHSVSAPLERLRQRGYVPLADLQPAIAEGSVLRAAQLTAENGYGLDCRRLYSGSRSGRSRAAAVCDDDFVAAVDLELDVAPELGDYITRCVTHAQKARCLMLLRTGCNTEKGVNLFRTTRAIQKLWEGRVAALVSCGKGVYWLRDGDEQGELFYSFQEAVEAVQGDAAYRGRLMLVHANNMDGCLTLQCQARVPVAAIFCGLGSKDSNINTVVNHLGRLTGYGMGLDGEPPTVFAHKAELDVAKAVPQFQNFLFTNAAESGDHAVGNFPATTAGLVESGVRQGSGKGNVIGHVR